MKLREGLHNWRTGNSLTGNAKNHLPSITQSAGYNHRITDINFPGSATRHIWKGFWEREKYPKLLKDNAPYDYYITQPEHEKDIAREVQMTGNFYREVLKHSPDTKLYVYVNWLEHKQDHILGPEVKISPETPEQWVQKMNEYMQWFEDLRVELLKAFPGKSVEMIPVGQALLRLKEEIEAGKVPGMTDFFEENIRDNIHATYKGAYLVGLVHYVCLYKENPIGLMAPNTMLTKAQQEIYERIAWETSINYPYSGVTAAASTRTQRASANTISVK
jgi:hypothetical protein